MELIAGKWVLDDLALVRFSGADAENFLHGQLTNSVKDLIHTQARPGAYCTAQGRLLANCFYWLMADNSIGLVLAKDLLEPFIRRMRMYVLRSKVNIEPLSEYKLYGVAGKENMPLDIHNLPPWSCYSDSDGYWIKTPIHDARSCLALYISTNPSTDDLATDSSAWYAMCIAHGWPLIRLSAQEKFLPNALNMDLNGQIDFNKGCYPGQEIIARSHYRGTIKRRLAFAYADIGTMPSTDFTDLYANDTQKPIGRIIDYTIYNQRIYIAAEVNIADAANQSYLLTQDGPQLALELCNTQPA